MQSPCNLHLAGRAVAAQNQDEIPPVNGDRGRWLMTPVRLWKHHVGCKREDKKHQHLLAVGRMYISDGFPWNLGLNTTIIPSFMLSCLSASLIGQQFPTHVRENEKGAEEEKEIRSIKAVCWFVFKRSPKSSFYRRILAGNSLTISAVAVQSTRLHPDLFREAGPASPSLSSDRRKLMSVRLWVKPNGAQ